MLKIKERERAEMWSQWGLAAEREREPTGERDPIFVITSD